MQLPEHLATNDIRVVVVQRADGTIINVKGDDEPLVYHGCFDYTTEDARTVARALLEAADLADTWAGRSDAADTAMIAAHRAVRAAYALLRTTPGNAGDYLRAALDSLIDATEAIR
ncbi:hypothetical protein [Mycobacterium dioxanotrophicus]|nr:hypothetical protein [Mycobacterium dioxanotrophicus]